MLNSIISLVHGEVQMTFTEYCGHLHLLISLCQRAPDLGEWPTRSTTDYYFRITINLNIYNRITPININILFN